MTIDEDRFELDPVYVHARREAIVIVIIFLLFFAYCVPVSFWLGYSPGVAPGKPILGMPLWVFWGVFLPWIAANVITAWFCFFYMKLDPLEDEVEEDLSVAEKKGDGPDSVSEVGHNHEKNDDPNLT